MSVSFSQETNLECPECQAKFSVDAWAVVDAVERPDLAERCRNGSIFNVTCPNGHAGMLGAPLLYHDPARQTLVLAMPPEVDESIAQEIHQQLLSHLIPDPATQPPDYFDATRVVAPQFLAIALADDPEAAFAAYRASQQEAAHLDTPEERALSEVLRDFIQATTWEESRRILEAHPELATDNADGVLVKLIDIARQDKDESAERIIESHREFLQNVRRQGAEAAFAQVRSEATEPPATTDDPGVAALRELTTAQSPQDVLRAAGQFPILLEDEFLEQLKGLVLDARELGVKEAEGHWNRCLQTLLDLRRSGASPEQWEQVGRHLQNAEAVQVFQELAALGVNSEQALEQVLQQRPDLLERWNRATQPPGSDPQDDAV